MNIKNPVLYFLNILALEAKDIVFFPIWWYSGGFYGLLLGLKDFMANTEKSLALSVWIKNIFVPMYGQRDWQGFLISVFMRIVQIIGRGFSLLAILGICLAIAGIWLSIPVIIAYEILWQLDLVSFNLFI